ncbi:hypothetical protein ACU60T_25330 [Klebsiella aerogenes]
MLCSHHQRREDDLSIIYSDLLEAKKAAQQKCDDLKIKYHTESAQLKNELAQFLQLPSESFKINTERHDGGMGMEDREYVVIPNLGTLTDDLALGSTIRAFITESGLSKAEYHIDVPVTLRYESDQAFAVVIDGKTILVPADFGLGKYEEVCNYLKRVVFGHCQKP